ncbi:hypothetical protein GF342_04180 [Candidatus Woesearchaeota archaeon]|nr:hypothetical protein [Candidatus Woesearchaeota archaeon]
MTVFIVRYAEIALKGKNRGRFEHQLIRNIRDCAAYHGATIDKIERLYGRILVWGERLEVLRTVFGISSISPAQECERNIDSMYTAALQLVKKRAPETFCLKTQRLDKTFAHTSMEVSKIIGKKMEQQTHIPVNLQQAALTIGIEIMPKHVLIFSEKIECFGGLPVGVDSIAHIIVQHKKDVLAGLLMMKRGCQLICQDHPYTRILQSYGQREMHKKTPFHIASDNNGRITDYHPTTFYPLISYTDEEITHEVDNFQQVLDDLH